MTRRRPSRLAVTLVACTAGGFAGSCVGGRGKIEPPRPPEPLVTVVAPEVPDALREVEPTLPDPGVRPDEILSSALLRDPTFQAEVRRWVGYWSSTARSWFPAYLERMAWFEALVDSALDARGLPPSLRYLPVIESGYHTGAVSRASAVGMWQFMEGTAEGLGLRVERLVDERRDPVRSTDAAVRFLEQLRRDFGSWYLALAAYNAGPSRVERVLRRHAPLEPRTDALYWKVRRHLPRETRAFVPKFVAAAIVASSPAAHGYARAEEEDRFSFEEVTVPDATTLDVVARAAGVPEDEVLRLNPQYVRGMTPPGEAAVVRVPPGTAARFRTRYALIPPDERVTFVEHRVRRGETLSHIARRYGVAVADLRAANPGVRPRYLRVGAVLTVPVAPSARRRATAGS